MDFMTFIQNNMLYVGFIVVFSIGSIVYSVMRMRKMKDQGATFLQIHPDAAKVYLTSKAFITAEAVTIVSVNDDTPVMFNEGTKAGFYLVPGSNILSVDYTYTRPGVIHKTVSKSTGIVKVAVEAEANKSYYIGFDRKEEIFTFAEY